MTLILAPAAQAVPPQPGSVSAKISREDLKHFMAGVDGYQNRMIGLDAFFTASVDQFDRYANDMVPLIGSENPDDQAQLALLIRTVAMDAGNLGRWVGATKPVYERAFSRFLAMYLPAFSTTTEKAKLKAGVARMRAGFKAFFSEDIATLVQAADRLSNQDVSGFRSEVAVAQGSEAFTVGGFMKANRALLQLG